MEVQDMEQELPFELDPIPDLTPDQEDDLDMLVDMLSYKRPAWSKTEEEFIAIYLDTVEGMQADEKGNRWLRIGTAPILWSSHTDTVHRKEGYQNLYITDTRILGVDSEDSNCLGADCTTGVWIMLEMIKARVEGLYIFHRAEEIGGIGSRHIASKTPELLDGIQYAIAFDRKSTTSIITHQGARCCSDTFGNSLAAILGMGYELDELGIYTDTAEYTNLIGECTNISVGYYNQHCSSETQDVGFLFRLRDKLVSADFTQLVAERKPGEVDPEAARWSSKWWDDDEATYGKTYTGRYGGRYKRVADPYEVSPWNDNSSYGDKSSADESVSLYKYILNNPEIVCDFLESMQVSVEDLKEMEYT